MANQKRIDKQLKKLEKQYVEKTLAKESKAPGAQDIYSQARDRIVNKYAKVLLKAKSNDEEAKALTILKLKKSGLMLASAGATILFTLGVFALTAVPMGVGAAIGAGVGAAVGKVELGTIIGWAGGAAADGISVAASRKVRNYVEKVFDFTAIPGDKCIDAIFENKDEQRYIKFSIKQQAINKLRSAAGQAREAQANETVDEQPEA